MWGCQGLGHVEQRGRRDPEGDLEPGESPAPVSPSPFPYFLSPLPGFTSQLSTDSGHEAQFEAQILQGLCPGQGSHGAFRSFSSPPAACRGFEALSPLLLIVRLPVLLRLSPSSLPASFSFLSPSSWLRGGTGSSWVVPPPPCPSPHHRPQTGVFRGVPGPGMAPNHREAPRSSPGCGNPQPRQGLILNTDKTLLGGEKE